MSASKTSVQLAAYLDGLVGEYLDDFMLNSMKDLSFLSSIIGTLSKTNFEVIEDID